MCVCVCVLSIDYTFQNTHPSPPPCMSKIPLNHSPKNNIKLMQMYWPHPCLQQKPLRKSGSQINMPRENAAKCCIRVVRSISLYNNKSKTTRISYCEFAAAAIHCCYRWVRIGIRLVGGHQALEEEEGILARRS